MKPPLSQLWDSMEDAAKWAVMDKTDLRGLQKCNAACQPWRRLKSEWKDKLQETWSKME